MTRARDVANLIGSGNFSSTTFTATAGQTAFTISHTQGFVQVFMNGLLLDETVDYTSNGSAVTLTSGAAAGDEIEVVAYNTFSVGAALHQAAADTRYVNATGDTVTGALTVDTSTTTNLNVDSANYGGIQFKAAGTDTGYITSFSNGSGAETMYMGGADTVAIHTGTNHALTGGTTRLLIDGSGAVTMPNQPGFQVSGNFAWRDYGSTYTEVTDWRSNQSGYYNSGMFSNATGRATAPVAGTYLFNFVVYTNNSGDASHYGHPAINGSSFGDAIMLYSSNDTNYPDNTVSGSYQISLGANDYVSLIWRFDMYGYHTHFSGHLIG